MSIGTKHGGKSTLENKWQCSYGSKKTLQNPSAAAAAQPAAARSEFPASPNPACQRDRRGCQMNAESCCQSGHRKNQASRDGAQSTKVAAVLRIPSMSPVCSHPYTPQSTESGSRASLRQRAMMSLSKDSVLLGFCQCLFGRECSRG